ncbi:MAG: hypothetical protein HY903_21645 [Deltaproteobacteria bacterium]|nr:hypothetical protein [Deltaproteobacteria bacterium]
MAICPSCRAEYEAGTSRCAECNVALVDRLPDLASSEDTADIYACYDPQQAVRLAEILHAEGIDVLVRDRSSNLFPTNVGKGAQRILAVATHETARARDLIAAAIKDGVVPDEGEALES